MIKDVAVIIWTYLCDTACVANDYSYRNTLHVDSIEPGYQKWEMCP